MARSSSAFPAPLPCTSSVQQTRQELRRAILEHTLPGCLDRHAPKMPIWTFRRRERPDGFLGQSRDQARLKLKVSSHSRVQVIPAPRGITPVPWRESRRQRNRPRTRGAMVKRARGDARDESGVLTIPAESGPLAARSRTQHRRPEGASCNPTPDPSFRPVGHLTCPHERCETAIPRIE